MLPCPCGTGLSHWVLGCGYFGRRVLPCPGSVMLGDNWAVPMLLLKGLSLVALQRV